ncbi:hypothetical protein [Variovorax sp. YR216]|uniref:hypothetical protein n=1 Tax=Variovorax sp. YR216 TaxID=1882828 RepID=UPI00089CF8A5|nr:hypothetical protein [Variovorax sp. YR216]SEB09638.1 hypothetical protein SAMN05444680_107205 [Variovorax sp. YR216]
MYKPSDSLPHRQVRRGARLAAVSLVVIVTMTGIALQWPRGATAAVAAIIGGDDRVAPQVAPALPAAGGKAPATYQLRCWQYGRLLFDEGPVTLGAEARQGAKMVATDRRGGALIVTADLGGTTCLARPYPPPPSLWLPR